MKKIAFLLITICLFANNLEKKAKYYYDMGDFKKAAILYSHLCNKGDYKDCVKAADIYNYAKGVEADYHKAYNLYLKACNHKIYEGCEKMGILFYNGTGIKRNYFKALYFLKKACFHNIGTACYVVGNYYAYHTKKHLHALFYYKKACQKGNILGCFAKNRRNW